MHGRPLHWTHFLATAFKSEVEPSGRLTCAEATRSTSPPLRSCRLSVCGSGRPSFSQVSEGVGIPEASQWSSSTLFTTTDTSAVPPEPSMRGGSCKGKHRHMLEYFFFFFLPFTEVHFRNCSFLNTFATSAIYTHILSEERKNDSCETLTQHFEVEVAARLAGRVVGHAGVASRVVDLRLGELQAGVEVGELEVRLWIQSVPVLEPGHGRRGRPVGHTEQRGGVPSDHGHVLGAACSVQTGRH